MREIVCRTSNRVFVGLPLCTSVALLDDNFSSFVSCSGRNADWIDLNSRFALDVMKDATFLHMFPKALVPWVSHNLQFCSGLQTDVVISLAARFVSSTARCIKQGMEHLDPIIKERLKCMDEYGAEWTDKPVSYWKSVQLSATPYRSCKGRLSPVFDGRERGEYDKTADSAHTNHELCLDTRKRPLEV